MNKQNSHNLLKEDLIISDNEKTSLGEQFSYETIKNNLGEGEKLMSKEDLSLVNPPKEQLIRLSKIRRSKFLTRMFHPMKEGSLRGTTLLFVRMTFGVGVLTLPYYMKQFGGLMGVLVLFLAAYMNYITYSIMAEVGNDHGVQDFLLLVKKFSPNSIFQIFRICYLTDLISMIIFFTILLYNVFGYLMAFTGLVPDEWFYDKELYKYKEYSKEMFIVRAIYLVLSFIFLLPFMFKESLGPLKIVSNYYLVVLGIFVLFNLIEMAFFRKNLEQNENFKVDYFISNPKPEWVECFFAVLLSYYSQTYFFKIRNELMHPTTKRLKKLSFYSVAIMFIFFVILCLICYFCLGNENMPELVILRTPYQGKSQWSETMFRVLICIFFLMSLISLTVFNPSVRDFIFSEFKIEKNNKNWILVSAFPFVLGAILCLVSPSIIGAWNFFGLTIYNFNG